MSDALLENLQSVLGVLSVESVEVADAADTGEDRLILDEGVLGSEGCDGGDSLASAKGLESLVLDVAALHDDGGAHDGAADFFGAAVLKTESSLATDHAGTVAEHSHNDKRVRVVVPSNSRGFCVIRVVVVLNTSLVLVVDGDVDVGDIEVDGGDQLGASNLRDLGDNLRGPPSTIGERRLLWSHSSHHIRNEVRRVLAVVQNLLAEDLSSHLENGLLSEKRERIADSVGSDAPSLETNLLHGVDFLGRRVVEMLVGIESLSLGSSGFVDESLGDLLRRSSSPTSLWPVNKRCWLLLDSDDAGHDDGVGFGYLEELRLTWSWGWRCCV